MSARFWIARANRLLIFHAAYAVGCFYDPDADDADCDNNDDGRDDDLLMMTLMESCLVNVRIVRHLFLDAGRVPVAHFRWRFR